MQNPFGTSALGFEDAASLMSYAIEASDARLREMIKKIGSKPDPSAIDMLSLQMYIQTWTVVIETTSAIIKDISDLFKAIIQRM
ncbi:MULTISPECIES: EscF/YscF/HrpA family type III secretion system needle major subunit [Candidatus Ichthyocystis]|uniref:EscF/YscF/HrpA family type III secretion system needle major subunit n=1 Tax=Candidatus Ichthyocystis TaxID=2929841 RepID=UPI000B86AE86|nr:MULTISPECIES: EscF/YscF/HrpA family type III secretion system needle major subunit [Ichthyocystis]